MSQELRFINIIKIKNLGYTCVKCQSTPEYINEILIDGKAENWFCTDCLIKLLGGF